MQLFLLLSIPCTGTGKKEEKKKRPPTINSHLVLGCQLEKTSNAANGTNNTTSSAELSSNQSRKRSNHFPEISNTKKL